MANKWKKVSSVQKDGKTVGTVVRSDSGIERTLLTLHGKIAKAQAENKSGVQLSNKVDSQGNFLPKTDRNGMPRRLGSLQRQRNNGMIRQAGASAAAYNASKGNGGKKNG
ncbi:MAG: hypothetical protein NC132_07085 [Corallococcus sp.]|nr:hypothetical protein [Corallococcus sp.]